MDREHQRRGQAATIPSNAAARRTPAVSVVRSCASATTTPSLLWSLPGLAGSARPPWPDFLHDRVDGYDDFAGFIRGYAPEAVADECGVGAGDIRTAARLYATARPALSFHGLGVTEHHQGTEGVMCPVNLALLTGNLGRPGAGVNPLRGQNNVQGAAHMGCTPAHLPGYAPLARAREHVARVWGVEIPEAPGLDAMEMIDATGRGELRALYVVGWDILMTQPNTTATRRALAELDSLVVQDVFLNETARELATVFLPAASAFEKDGTFMSSERRIQRVRRVLVPPDGARPDGGDRVPPRRRARPGRPLRLPGHRGGLGRDPPDLGPRRRHLLHRLDAPGGLQWPCEDEDDPIACHRGPSSRRSTTRRPPSTVSPATTATR
jgi:formate dehydrogenase major subunit